MERSRPKRHVTGGWLRQAEDREDLAVFWEWQGARKGALVP